MKNNPAIALQGSRLKERKKTSILRQREKLLCSKEVTWETADAKLFLCKSEFYTNYEHIYLALCFFCSYLAIFEDQLVF